MTRGDGDVELTADNHDLSPGQTYSTGLYHSQHDDDSNAERSYVNDIRRRTPEADLARSLAEWKRWLAQGKALSRLIPNARAREMVEGCLLACKMQQDRDGGTMAGARRYANSYVRDTHGAVRLFLATGHMAEAKKAIETIDHKWSVGGFIPNYWSMGSDSFLGRSFVNDDSEIPAYYVLMIRDYFAATKDARFVDQIEPSMKWAIDAQLGFMEKNGWRITFNGDETEQYCCREDGQEYGGFPAFKEWSPTAWSFPSAALACASTQFYIDYLRSKGRTDEASACGAKLGQVKDAIDATFLRRDLTPGIHAWKRDRDGGWPTTTLPNYDLIPLWIGARLNGDRENADALAMVSFLDPKTGYLPTAPPAVEGFCGHNLGYLLYDLKKLNDPRAAAVLHTMLNSKLLGCWGTVSEFYGPGGTSNGHNFREFEGGIDAEAVVRYYGLIPSSS